MAYTEVEARKLVIEAGLLLVEKKLVARTWGNISARISDNEFIITPSGKAYKDLKEEDLVKVKIDDLSYEGNIKPSSEKKIHASAYALRNEVNFIIHTHQDYATAISVEGVDYPFAPCAKYGLPGTKKLQKNVSKVIKDNPYSSSFLLERHGALILGLNFDDCFNKTNKLEDFSIDYFKKNTNINQKNKKDKPYLDDYAQMFGFKEKACEDDLEAIVLIKHKNALAKEFANKAKPMNFFDVILQNFVYKKKYSKLKGK